MAGTIQPRTHGPLRAHPQNGRYFADASGRAVLLTGSHTWGNMQDQLDPDPDVVFDYSAYLEWMVHHHHNFMRGWMWEQTSFDTFTRERIPYRPQPYLRTGPDLARDGLPKFDLERINPAYLQRLRERVIAAGQHGIYVSVMLFQGWSISQRNPLGNNAWDGHPFCIDNNINNIDGDPHGTGAGHAIHTLAIPAVTRLQEAYVHAVVDAVNDLDNVLYEIGNEHNKESWAWQCHMIELIHAYERCKPDQHPVGMTSGGGSPNASPNAQLAASPADWISPRHEPEQPYRDDPPASDGSQLILTDTDHLWGMGGNVGWVWKSVCRGLNPLLMDAYESVYGLDADPEWGALNRRDHPIWQPIRDHMGHARRYSERMQLARCVPCGELASTGYCLADRGHTYLVYAPSAEPVKLDLRDCPGSLRVEWFDIATAHVVQSIQITGGAQMSLESPCTDQAVLFLSRTH